MNNKTILITGGSGFLGTYLVDYLGRLSDVTIVIFDKLLPTKQKNKYSIVTSVRGDLLSKRDVSRVFATYGPFDTVYHLASAMPNREMSDDLTWKTNVIGTVNVASEAVRRDCRSFVFTSSNVTYGIPEALPVTEKTPPRPLEVYGKSKLQAERELEAFKKDMSVQIFRCPVITGIGRLGLQAILFEFISENHNIYVLGDGLNRYQFVDAMDVCTALEKASHKNGFDIYVIGGDGVMPLRAIYQSVIDAAGSRSRIVSLPKGLSLAMLSFLDRLRISPLGIYQYTMIGRSLYADTTKIKKKLGWKPTVTNEDSFIKNYTWYVNHKAQFANVGSGKFSDNRSLPRMGIFKLLKLLS